MSGPARRLARRLAGPRRPGDARRGRRAQPGARVDWPLVRARIAAADVALAAADVAPELLERVWARRAERLARLPAEAERGEPLWLVVARLGRELYGLDARQVVAIRPAGRITPVPRTPAWVAGMVNVRGRILSAVDLQRFLELPPAGAAPAGAAPATAAAANPAAANPAAADPAAVNPAPANVALGNPAAAGRAPAEGRTLVVVEAPGMVLALLVDEVAGVAAVPLAQLQDPAGVRRGLPPAYVQGVAEYGADGSPQLLDVLDIRALLADPRLVVHEAIL
jgi:purine-binding chemotaxis protein CheW